MKKISILCLGLVLMLLSKHAAAQCTATISISGTTVMCPGSTTTLTASGAATYSWYATGSTVYSNSVVLTPTASICYTVVGLTGGGCYGATAVCITLNASPITISSTGNNVCAGGMTTLTANGGSSYTWTPGNITATSVVVSPTASTCYTVTGNNGGACTGVSSAVQCITVSGPPSVSILGASSVCSGATAILTASGAVSYTWSTGATTSNINVAPGCYTVIGANGTCTNSAVHCFSATPSPTITISGNNTLCNGSSDILTASGALSYTWSNGTSGATTNVTASGCYTVVGGNGNGCFAGAVKCVTVLPTPTITITGSTITCANIYNGLVASGASSYTWNTGATGSMINGDATGCYTVTGTNAFGCTGSAALCVTALPSPTVTISGSNTVCAGSSINLTASGAASYAWNTGATTSTVTMLTTTATPSPQWFMVNGTGSNGCSDSAVVVVTINTNCAEVWPGDANSDGTVDNTDVFEIGLSYAVTGAPRTPGGNAYTAQYATTWSGNGSTGKNKCHIDCNGDGTIDDGDTLAIYNNYGMNHSFRPSNSTSTNPDIQIVAPTYMTADSWNSVQVMLGDANNNQSQVYGVAFDINFDQSLVDPNEVYMVYSSSFLNASDHNVQFKKADFNNGVLHGASVRTDGANVSGNGKIADVYFKLKSGIANNTIFNTSVLNSTKINSASATSILAGNAAISTIVVETVGIKENTLQKSISCYPNPVTDKLVLQNASSVKVDYHIYDILGKEISKGDFTQSKTIDMSSFQKGTYMIRFENGFDSSYKKLIVE